MTSPAATIEELIRELNWSDTTLLGLLLNWLSKDDIRYALCLQYLKDYAATIPDSNIDMAEFDALIAEGQAARKEFEKQTAGMRAITADEWKMKCR